MMGCARLVVTIRGRRIVDGVSLEVAAGEVLAVLGANGAGKSTLLAALAGDLVPAEGEVSLCGRPMKSWSMAERAQRRAVLMQHTEVGFEPTVREVVALGLGVGARGVADDALVTEALIELGLGHLHARGHHTLSGGEQQRVHCARVFVQLRRSSGERYLLLDEPTSSLDLATQRLVLERVRARASEGIGVIVVMHDLNLACTWADRVALLGAGKLIAQGTPAEVIRREHLSNAFGVEVEVVPHPRTGLPLMLPLTRLQGATP